MAYNRNKKETIRKLHIKEIKRKGTIRKLHIKTIRKGNNKKITYQGN